MGLGPSTRTFNMSGETAKFVKEAINKDSVVIFSKTYCPYCKMAKEVCYFTNYCLLCVFYFLV